MSVVLVNGDGNPAVYASQDADLLGGIGGQETGILDINDKFAATIADANTVEISSGVCITKEGRRIQIDVGDVEEIVVPTGSQGTTKYYIIGFHLYTDGSGNQLAETFIDEVASPSATITEKMFKDGETEVYVSLYRITRNGLNLEGLTLILPEIGSLAGGGIIGDTDISGIGDGTVTGAIAQINTDLSIRYNPQTDMVQIYYNGTWNDWKYGGMQQLNLFKDGILADGFELTGGLSISSSLLNVYRPSSQSTAVKNYITPTIDNSNGNYTTATIEATSNSSNAAYLRVGFSDSVYADFPASSTSYSTQTIDISSVSQIDVYGMMINSYGTGLIRKIILS